jgi:Flp pilus assembly protein TadD
MKKANLSFLATFVAIAMFLGSCAGLKKMKDQASLVKFEAVPSVLELKGGEVEVTVNGTFPEKYFNKKAVLTITPVLKYDGGEVAYPSLTVQGEGVEANNKVIKFATGDKVTINGKVPYVNGMLVSSLEVRMKASLKKESLDLPSIKIADGVISTPLLAVIDPKVIPSTDNYQRTTPNSYEAEILYLIDQADVRSSELKKDNIKGVASYIAGATGNARRTISSIKISSYASPDGEYDKNDKLSVKRKESANSYLLGEFKKLKVQKASVDSLVSAVTTAEDWDGFKSLMEKSNIKDKDLILRVLSMYSDPEVREKEIRNIAAAWPELKTDILPLLRRSKLTVNVNLVGYSDAELINLAQTKPDTLNLEELLYAANLISDLSQKIAVYQKAAAKFPGDYRAQNNIGYFSLKQNKLAEAKAAFEAAKAIKNDDVVKNNLGAVAILEGDFAKAEETLTAATNAGAEVNYNLGIIKLQKGEYDAAINYFGSTAENNAGLAKLLAGKYDAALATLGAVKNEDALTSYLKAIIGARTANNDLLFNNLRTAIAKDAKWKDYVKKDAEFIKFVNNEVFKSIVQ